MAVCAESSNSRSRSTLLCVLRGAVVAFVYLTNQGGKLVVCTQDERLELDNNRAERPIRLIANGRKAWLFSKSESGAHASRMQDTGDFRHGLRSVFQVLQNVAHFDVVEGVIGERIRKPVQVMDDIGRRVGISVDIDESFSTEVPHNPNSVYLASFRIQCVTTRMRPVKISAIPTP